MAFRQINKSCVEGTLPLDNYSGFKPGDLVWVPSDRGGTRVATVKDVRFINSPSSALYYVLTEDWIEGLPGTFYPEQLKKINL